MIKFATGEDQCLQNENGFIASQPTIMQKLAGRALLVENFHNKHNHVALSEQTSVQNMLDQYNPFYFYFRKKILH